MPGELLAVDCSPLFLLCSKPLSGSGEVRLGTHAFGEVVEKIWNNEPSDFGFSNLGLVQ